MEFKEFLGILQSIKGKNLFNPYTDICIRHDKRNADFIRRHNLKQYFSIINHTNTLLIGEAPGYLGCRRTGLPFTDELTFTLLKKIYDIDMLVATKSGKNKEQSATQMWKILSKLEKPPFLWNIVPIHPYNEDNQLSNRTPSKTERKLMKEVVKYFFDHTNFSKVFAIGKVATGVLVDLLGLKEEDIYIRHPSYGGSEKFKNKIAENFQLKKKVDKKKEKLTDFFGINVTIPDSNTIASLDKVSDKGE
ncbi:hypothetical protein LCGC14_0495080 [marine sediment metagenome]|uniref:Uracil-DNA glycosylase-like domain-containing protein n=1 Tax=marine sediment metagenome TaxID=412755 RepID=A0A0F9USD5_9ZZZZ